MVPGAFIRASVSVLFSLMFVLQAANLGAQAGGNTGGSAAGSTGAYLNPGSRRSSQASQAQVPSRQLFISGSAVTSNGLPLPMGAVIERVCNGRVTREAYVDSRGLFAFQVGAGIVMPDASDIDMPSQSQLAGGMAGFASGYDSRMLTALAGCELRAHLAGYRSTLIHLNPGQLTGQVDVGTIILHPVAEVRGTTVSVTEMLAPKKARKSLEKAEKAFEKNEWARAQAHLQDALAEYPAYATAWLRLGYVLREMCRIDEARNAFAKAIAADSDFAPPYIGLARLAVPEGSWQEVADLTEHAMKLDPLDYPLGFYLNAMANLNLGRLDVAESSVRKAQRIDNQHRLPQTHLLLANILHRQSDHDAEIEQLRHYLRYDPQSVEAEQVRYRLQLMELTGRR